MAAPSDRAQARALWCELVRAQAVALPAVHKVLRLRHGLSLTELLVLQAVEASPSAQATMSDLQEATYLSAAGTTRVAAALEVRRLMTRTRREGDRRLLYVALTPGGTALAADAQATVDTVVLDLLREASWGAEVAAATRVLALLAGAPEMTVRKRTRTSPTARVRRF